MGVGNRVGFILRVAKVFSAFGLIPFIHIQTAATFVTPTTSEFKSYVYSSRSDGMGGSKKTDSSHNSTVDGMGSFFFTSEEILNFAGGRTLILIGLSHSSISSIVGWFPQSLHLHLESHLIP